jgi:hypothetical protein
MNFRSMECIDDTDGLNSKSMETDELIIDAACHDWIGDEFEGLSFYCFEFQP